MAALRRPGAQLKEVFLPIPQVYANLQATQSLSIEAFAQLNHEKVVIDGCGTLFSPADLLNCGNSGSGLNPGALALGGTGTFINFSRYTDRQTLTGGGDARVETADGTDLGPASTLMACPDGKKKQAFVPVVGDGFLLRYNSKLPVVVYVPNDVEVRYRIWSASDKVGTAISE